MRFQFLKVELKQKNWREYIRQDNPVAAALLSKMGYRVDERVEVKKEFLRMLVRLEQDPARMTLLTGFFDTYLTLNEEEERQLRMELQKLDPDEGVRIMEITTSWHEKGREEGRVEGRAEGRLEMLYVILQAKFGDIWKGTQGEIEKLAVEDSVIQELVLKATIESEWERVQSFIREKCASPVEDQRLQ